MTHGPRLWATIVHDCRPKSSPSRALRARAAAAGLRQAVQVIDGNYELAVGTCAWWDGAGHVRAHSTPGARPQRAGGLARSGPLLGHARPPRHPSLDI